MDAFRWIAERSEDAAVRWYSGLLKATAKRADKPERNPIAVEESERFGITIRQSLYGRKRGVYRILYSVEANTVSVLAIRHSSRDLIEP
jgi:plasmid stabilization system protein ParE